MKERKLRDPIRGNVSTRSLCCVLDDMRSCHKTRNFSYLPGLIEEAQYRANRMENAIEKIGGWEGVRSQEKQRIKLKKEIKDLEEKRDKLKEQVPEEKKDEKHNDADGE